MFQKLLQALIPTIVGAAMNWIYEKIQKFFRDKEVLKEAQKPIEIGNQNEEENFKKTGRPSK